MSAPIRWKEVDSGAPAELSALMRYAHTRKPDEAQLASLTAAVLAQLPTAPTTGKIALTASSMKLGVLGVIVVAGGLVWQGVRLDERRPSAATRAPALEAAHVPPPALSVPDGPPPQPTVMPAEPVAPKSSGRGVRQRGAKPAVQVAAPGTASDVTLLQAARQARKAAPQRALDLLSEHERRYPDSMFSEEREALRIEILQRKDPTEAARRLRDFDTRFPHSIYRQRIGDAADQADSVR
jgi:hypothetical protein